jgi:hypothetical protein
MPFRLDVNLGGRISANRRICTGPMVGIGDAAINGAARPDGSPAQKAIRSASMYGSIPRVVHDKCHLERGPGEYDHPNRHVRTIADPDLADLGACIH